ncbi:tegument protein VP11/12 [Psittacid alphaherpesvirus 1]|nr:tegument protein VP11/12 [Psittacid alphaherpesvirus 1]
MTLRSVELKKIPIKVLKTVFENAQKISPVWSLEQASLNSLAATAETMLPGPILGPSRAEHFNGPDPTIPDKMVVRMVEGDHKMLFRATLDDTYHILVTRIRVREKFVQRLARAMYTRRASMLMDVELPFKDKMEGVYAAADLEAICKMHYWVFPHTVPAPNMKSPDDKAYLTSVAQFARSTKFIESYMYYMRPHDPEVNSTDTGNRVAAMLIYIHGMQCKLASLFDALDAAILRSKFNAGSRGHSLSGIYGFTRNGKGTMMAAKSSGNVVEQIRRTCPFGSDAMVECLISALDRMTYLVARWELMSVDKRDDAKAAIAAGMGLAWLLNGHLSYLTNMIMTVYVLWLPEHYLNPRLILTISSRVLLGQLLCTSHTTFRENATCPKMLLAQNAVEWKKQERGTAAWLDYVCARAWLRASRENRKPANITAMNNTLEEISAHVLKILEEAPQPAASAPSSLCATNYCPDSPPSRPPPPPPVQKRAKDPGRFSRIMAGDDRRASVQSREDGSGYMTCEHTASTSTKLRGRVLSAPLIRHRRKSAEGLQGAAKLRGGSLRLPDNGGRAALPSEPPPSSESTDTSPEARPETDHK